MSARVLRLAVILSLATPGCTSSRKAEDPANALGSVVYLSDSEPSVALATGPFVLTDVTIDGHAWQVFMSSDAACSERNQGGLFELNEPRDKPTTIQSHHGMKLMITAGNTLCFHSSVGQTKLVWAGTRTGH